MNSNVRYALLALLALMVVGTLGYSSIEGWSLLDSVYMTVITLSTVGFGELHPLSTQGKLFTSLLVLFGVGTLAYAATQITESIIERGIRFRPRMQREIKRMQGHVIVCGYGRMGETVCQQLLDRDEQLVVIEKDPGKTERLDQLRIPFILGDATEDAVLARAGTERATALATVLPHDADNLFVTLSARSLNAKLTVVARASKEKNESKMINAGATRVLNPYSDGGRRMVRQLLHPAVTDFMDVIIAGMDPDLSLEEVQLQPGSSLADVMLRDGPIRRDMDVIVLGVRRKDSELVFNPPPDLAPQAGDVLVVVGRKDNLHRLAKLADRVGPQA